MCNQDKEPVHYLLRHLIMARFECSLILSMLGLMWIFPIGVATFNFCMGLEWKKKEQALVFSVFGFDVN